MEATARILTPARTVDNFARSAHMKRLWRPGSGGTCIFALVGFGLAAQSALAQAPTIRGDYRLRLSGGYSDNFFRVPVDPQTSSYKALGVSFNAERESQRFRSSFAGDVERRDYSQPTVSDEPVGSINARIDVDVVPDLFIWTFNDSYGQGRVNPFQTMGPTNRQEVNVFSTGPRLTVPLGSRTRMEIEGTHERRRFDNTGQLDSDSNEVLLGVTRQVSQATQVGLSWTRREITYADLLPSWEDDTVFLSYRRQLASGSTSVRIGENTVGVNGVETSGPLFDGSWIRELGGGSNIGVSVRRDFIDPGDRFLSSNTVGNVGPLGPNDVFLGAGVYEYSELALSHTIGLPRTTLSWGVGAGESRYLSTVVFDSDDERLFFSFNRSITERLRVGIGMTAYEVNYPGLDSTTTDHVGQAWLGKDFGRRTSLQFSYLRDTRDAKVAAPFEYDEDAYRLSLEWDLNP